MVRALSLFIGLFGAVCLAIGCAHFVLGPQAIPGAVPVNATMDSEDRFYGTLFAAFGLAHMWIARDLVRRAKLLWGLQLAFFAGGIARIVSWVAVGPPDLLFRFLGSLELIIPPLIWWWYRRALDTR